MKDSKITLNFTSRGNLICSCLPTTALRYIHRQVERKGRFQGIKDQKQRGYLHFCLNKNDPRKVNSVWVCIACKTIMLNPGSMTGLKTIGVRNRRKAQSISVSLYERARLFYN